MTAGIKSFVGARWVGYCLEHVGQEMFLNSSSDGNGRGNSYECPVCHLQVLVLATSIEVMSPRGIGDFTLTEGKRQSAVDARPFQSGMIDRDCRPGVAH
jgi:hypothetical protein